MKDAGEEAEVSSVNIREPTNLYKVYKRAQSTVLSLSTYKLAPVP